MTTTVLFWILAGGAVLVAALGAYIGGSRRGYVNGWRIGYRMGQEQSVIISGGCALCPWTPTEGSLDVVIPQVFEHMTNAHKQDER
jgi:hypothetical protein